jgi:predicted branched-subunit amino acid permease
LPDARVVISTSVGTLPERSAARQAARDGARAMAPFLVGLLPFGLAIGAAVAASPVDDLVGWATAPALFSGGVQVTTIELLGAGASVVTVAVSVLALTARLAVYGASLAPTLEHQPGWFRWLAPYFVVEPVVAIATQPEVQQRAPLDRRWHYLGASGSLWAMWTASVAVGVVVSVPASLAFDFAAPLCLLALLGRRLRAAGRGGAWAAVVGSVVALLVLVAPTGLAVAVAIVAGAVAGAVTERRAR